MLKTWVKTGINIKMTVQTAEGEKVLRRGFTNAVKNVSAEQVEGLGKILESISDGKFSNGTVTTTEKVENQSK
ncbi:hypothetical protein [Pediococcus claussenii]|uniref:Uncharacterized protein n=1 Tax=Pediococcus claussenii (strain ATCC BAA-344 / DSM 14800 / JCM 18046 / KCTC 3811 / LMG 21948 / P06) TaxID=701521 RepID=G8PBV3_PEDCP|nr:hypothetical protein [Pediococcus claussenii]AEV96011.1 hypothetical protein PECL_1799 [Pediococcus claussenii ATCC BAA-344]ANZ69497.1 hypothetical protein AYR57_03860 [Pediococcus claussenii]ANZ71316.1 hypothetical protein AYR58_03875 [Pediococcus claussenii]KRN19463.1 hypothetical protein IV79_GL001516 [Pediococcus claussenii]